MFDGLWWAVVTLTTVGYGDIQPVTAGGRILATVAMFAGIGVIGSACGIMAMRCGSGRRRGGGLAGAVSPRSRAARRNSNADPHHSATKNRSGARSRAPS